MDRPDHDTTFLARFTRLQDRLAEGYDLWWTWRPGQPRRYEACARGATRVTAHPYAVVTADLDELAAALGVA